MKKLLYITANTKPEDASASKTAGRRFINNFISKNQNNYAVEELDLYNENIPEINHRIFIGRGQLVSGDIYNSLSEEDKKKVDRINALCDQFLSADTYVIAAPMWSLSCPSRLKSYLDCIMVNDKIIKISGEDAVGLLDDKIRNMVYIQSCGEIYPKIFSSKFNHAINYFRDVFKFLGINKFESILIEGTDTSSIGTDKALENCQKDIENVVTKFSKDTSTV
ncbi:FMN-dependent NADH-azoreductase [Clostridium luticellarii]|uniref:FMN dependent NADH:quinone oxidoreductase n=1 Tax=Clostridium luticellarii TaxID=1691940 RepID=A0A2T0BLF8_9CLOT|nr:NAD(P)H-dependent oxidoreductase [Clostridium luticellarii]PRR84673.1 FMN-dependent NADH-azoreductase 2 [Clostridium luticellarii]